MAFSKPINDVSMERSVPQFWLIYSPGVFIENVCPILFPAENTEYQLTLLLFLYYLCLFVAQILTKCSLKFRSQMACVTQLPQ